MINESELSDQKESEQLRRAVSVGQYRVVSVEQCRAAGVGLCRVVDAELGEPAGEATVSAGEPECDHLGGSVDHQLGRSEDDQQGEPTVDLETTWRKGQLGNGYLEHPA
jgi:hypothetical protein